MEVKYAESSVIGKIVYYGPGLSGKTTNLEQLFAHLRADQKLSQKVQSLPTATERTLYFDFLPINQGKVGNFDVKLSLYTVPGQVFYYATRKLVLDGTHAAVFVADSQEEMRESNVEALVEMQKFLTEYKIDYADIPVVLQFNKRDLPNIMTVEEMKLDLQKFDEPVIEAVATENHGVTETLETVVKNLLKKTRAKIDQQQKDLFN